MNLNDSVSFRLTEAGVRYLLARPPGDVPHCFWPQLPNLAYLRMHALVLPQPRLDVDYELPLWEFCATFGGAFSMVAEPPTQGNEVHLSAAAPAPGTLTDAALCVLEATRQREVSTSREAKQAAGLLLYRRVTTWRAAGFAIFRET